MVQLIDQEFVLTKTNKHLFVQVVDDEAGKTLFSVQTFGKNAVGKVEQMLKVLKLLVLSC